MILQIKILKKINKINKKNKQTNKQNKTKQKQIDLVLSTHKEIGRKC